MNNNKRKLRGKLISIGGIFVGLTVIFQAAPVFTTGILGLIIGILIYRKRMLISVLCSGFVLSTGISIMTFIIGVFQLESIEDSVPVGVMVLVFILFSIVYALIWNILIKKFVAYLIKIKILDKYLH